ncbi:MAG: F0F1 ATP synthase subunit epsilon [Acidobacteria bacterium]|nr:F0F1 ATP synthase subunit epsilon [Acidobacteriota bacterium]
MEFPSSLTFELVTPERAIVREAVDEVQVPGAGGYFGVLPGHTPLLAMLQVGELWFRQGSERFFVSVAYGFAEVLPDRVTVLAQVAERAEEVDVDRAEAAQQRAQARLGGRAADIDVERARIALLKSLVRLRVASKVRVRPSGGF